MSRTNPSCREHLIAGGCPHRSSYEQLAPSRTRNQGNETRSRRPRGSPE
uniref:Uncharacterized protein n=1 Tax=Rhizophora mucronata TaxID=61149 RepID=A0A2P2R1V4_RHIMU